METTLKRICRLAVVRNFLVGETTMGCITSKGAKCPDTSAAAAAAGDDDDDDDDGEN